MSEDFSIGIEEEYLLVNPETRSLAVRQREGFMDRCKKHVGDRVTYEFLQSQVEIGTGVCAPRSGRRAPRSSSSARRSPPSPTSST